MERIFKGRPVMSGNASGKAVKSRLGMNTLASFQKSVLAKKKTVICSDQNNPDLYGKELTGKVICLPKTIGSTTGGMILQTVAEMGLGPLALLFSEPIDSLAAAGVILAAVWNERRVVTVDGLGEEFLSFVQDGMSVDISEDGTIRVFDAKN